MKKRNKNNGQCASEYLTAYSMKKDIDQSSLLFFYVCLIAMLYCVLQIICSVGVKEILFICCAVFIVFAVIAEILFPMIILQFLNKTKKITSAVGIWLFRILLLPFYVLLCVIGLPFYKKKKEKLRFIEWNSPPQKADSYFSGIEGKMTAENSRGVKRTIINILIDLASTGQYSVILPVILLLILGLFFFFISSNSVFSFIYTLF